jgi:hypothetical protein
VLWLLSAVGLAGALQVAVTQELDLGELDERVTVALGASGYAALLWLAERRSLQQVALFAGVVASVYALGERARLGDHWIDLAVGLLGAAWLALGWGGLVLPQRTALVLGALALLAAPLLAAEGRRWPILGGLALVVALVASAAAARQGAPLGVGVAGLLVYLPLALDRYLHSSFSPLVALLLGLCLVGVAVGLGQLRRATSGEPGAQLGKPGGAPADQR